MAARGGAGAGHATNISLTGGGAAGIRLRRPAGLILHDAETGVAAGDRVACLTHDRNFEKAAQALGEAGEGVTREGAGRRAVRPTP
jgi:hypothetical protein